MEINPSLLEIVLKAVKNGVYTKYAKSLFGRCKLQKLNVGLVYSYGEYRLQPTHSADFSLYLDEYKTTWWLREDMSE